MSDCLDAALAYHAAGLHPIPIEPRGKRPLVAWQEFQKRQPFEWEIRQWWADTPDANVALVMGRGTFVVDVDGEEGFAALKEAGVDLDSYTGASTGKGAHYYFRGEVPDRIGALPKVDIRSDGGYVVAPPSIHASGRRYVWATPDWAMPTSFPEAPQALLELLDRPTKPTPAATAMEPWLTAALGGVGEGGRASACARIAGYFLGKGIPVDVVEELLLAWAARCTPPMDDDEVIRTVASIAKRDVPEPEPAPMGMADCVALTVQEALAPKGTRREPAATSLTIVDGHLYGGFAPGEYWLLGGRPGVGKSALARQMLRHVARAGQRGLYLSLEMSRSQFTRALLVQESQVSSLARALKTGEFTDIERAVLADTAKRVAALPITLKAGRVGIPAIEAAIEANRDGLGLVVVDYLQLVRVPEHRDPRQRVEHVSAWFKEAAVRYDVPILVLSSLARPPKDKPRWSPGLADLRESGELEHDADGVLLLHRPDLASPDTELFLAKNREGAAGAVVSLHYDGPRLTFTERTA